MVRNALAHEVWPRGHRTGSRVRLSAWEGADWNVENFVNFCNIVLLLATSARMEIFNVARVQRGGCAFTPQFTLAILVCPTKGGEAEGTHGVGVAAH